MNQASAPGTAWQPDTDQRTRRASLPETMVLLCDRDLRCVLLDGTLATSLALARGDGEGRRLAELLPADSFGELAAPARAALAGEPQTIELRWVDGDRTLEVDLTPFRADGAVNGVLTVWRDVTTRRARERETAFLAEIVNQSRDAIIFKNVRGIITQWNQGAAALYGYTAAEAVGSPIAMLVPPDRAGEDRELLARALAGQPVRQYWTTRVRRDGSRVEVSISLSPIYDAAHRVSGASVIARDIGERKRFEGRLQHLADHDSLTGLFNRQRFERELARAVADSNRYGTPCVLLMIDLDGFKYVNDTLGHPAGDELVAKVGRLLRDSLRETDVVARIGGDEFAAIITHAGQETGVAVCRKLLTALGDRAVMLSDRRQARVTASVGLTSFDGTPSVSAEELLVEADIAMYQAKEAGKNRVAIYSRQDGQRSRIVRRENWLERIRTAIETDGFELFAQPLRGIRAHDVAHFELLLRMRGDDGALILPSHFLASAERFDLVQGIDRWVFRQALGLLRRHHQAGHDIALSVNMSGKTLGDPDILADLAQMIADCPVPTGRLIVEVTETAAITTIDRAREVAVGLRELGCRFALDDFGAGFASFYYLKHLEFDYLKIDGEFVKHLTQSATDQLVVKAVVDIARGLGARTIAECVNDEAAVRCLDALGVDFGQGYHLGAPAPLELALPTG